MVDFGVNPIRDGAAKEVQYAVAQEMAKVAGQYRVNNAPKAQETESRAQKTQAAALAEVRDAAKSVEGAFRSLGHNLEFKVNESGDFTVTVTDPVTGDIIRQIPSETVLEIRQNLADVAAGHLFNEEA